VAEKSKIELGNSGRYEKAIVTEIINASIFYKAEEYHQDYHKKNPKQYKFYRFNCGRDQYLQKIWGEVMPIKYKKLSKEELTREL
jgi:peptide methionine sulfoxide reductase MsrA